MAFQHTLLAINPGGTGELANLPGAWRTTPIRRRSIKSVNLAYDRYARLAEETPVIRSHCCLVSPRQLAPSSQDPPGLSLLAFGPSETIASGGVLAHNPWHGSDDS